MKTKNSSKIYSNGMIIGMLFLVISATSILFFTPKNEDDKLETANMYQYEQEIKSPLLQLINYIGVQSIDSVNWDDNEEILRQDLHIMLEELNNGFTKLNHVETPKQIRLQLQQLHEKIGSISIHKDKPLDKKQMEKIINLSQSVYHCNLEKPSEDWDQVQLELECMNK